MSFTFYIAFSKIKLLWKYINLNINKCETCSSHTEGCISKSSWGKKTMEHLSIKHIVVIKGNITLLLECCSNALFKQCWHHLSACLQAKETLFHLSAFLPKGKSIPITLGSQCSLSFRALGHLCDLHWFLWTCKWGPAT